MGNRVGQSGGINMGLGKQIITVSKILLISVHRNKITIRTRGLYLSRFLVDATPACVIAPQSG